MMRRGWTLERALFTLAGGMTLLSAMLAWLVLLTAFVGLNQWLFAAVGDCPASLVLRRVCHLRPAASAAHEPGVAPGAR